MALFPAIAWVCLALPPCGAGATEEHLPLDFHLHPATYGGAGGGQSRAERAELRRYPVIMVPGLGRDHRDWTGTNPGNALPVDRGSVYGRLTRAGFRPIELWMIDFARAGEQMTSVEEATDDLKFFIAAVMRYTGADRVQLLAHDTGCILARLTVTKYHIAHWVESEVYIAGPFHGVSAPPAAGTALRGYPNAWWPVAGSELLREVVACGESPVFRDPLAGRSFQLDTLTVRNGCPGGDPVFADCPDSPALAGARNVVLPGLDHDGLRCSAAASEVFLPFLDRQARPYVATEDLDADGFRGAAFGGPDCDDNDPLVFPGAEEIRGDGRDQDCNGCDLAAHGGRDVELPVPIPPAAR